MIQIVWFVNSNPRILKFSDQHKIADLMFLGMFVLMIVNMIFHIKKMRKRMHMTRRQKRKDRLIGLIWFIIWIGFMGFNLYQQSKIIHYENYDFLDKTIEEEYSPAEKDYLKSTIKPVYNNLKKAEEFLKNPPQENKVPDPKEIIIPGMQLNGILIKLQQARRKLTPPEDENLETQILFQKTKNHIKHLEQELQKYKE